jgi:FkbM family methyltransferase
MNKHLVFDIGLHVGQDSKFYLAQGYKVVGVDASPVLVAQAHKTFGDEIKEGRMIVVNKAIASEPGIEMSFYMSEKTDWNSLKKVIASRIESKFETIAVGTTTLPILFEQYGTPYYCKIDIEGYDDIALRTLASARELPLYISCETECLGENEVFTEEEALATLRTLKALGYKKFKLVDQESLTVLSDRKFYRLNDNTHAVPFRILRKAFHLAGYKIVPYTEVELLSFQHQFYFEMGSSGPFGKMLKGNWANYQQARDQLLFHRDHFFKLAWPHKVYNIWCDWHATF